MSLGGVDLGGVGQELGGGRGQADDDGENDLKEKKRKFNEFFLKVV